MAVNHKNHMNVQLGLPEQESHVLAVDEKLGCEWRRRLIAVVVRRHRQRLKLLLRTKEAGTGEILISQAKLSSDGHLADRQTLC